MCANLTTPDSCRELNYTTFGVQRNACYWLDRVVFSARKASRCKTGLFTTTRLGRIVGNCFGSQASDNPVTRIYCVGLGSNFTACHASREFCNWNTTFASPVQPTEAPTTDPSTSPTVEPTTAEPSGRPTVSPTLPTSIPTRSPTTFASMCAAADFGATVHNGNFCRFQRSSCPSGWRQYRNWRAWQPTQCRAEYMCRQSASTSCTTSGAFSDTNLRPYCRYSDNLYRGYPRSTCSYFKQYTCVASSITDVGCIPN